MLFTSIGLFGIVAIGAALPRHGPPTTTLATATRSNIVVTSSGANPLPIPPTLLGTDTYSVVTASTADPRASSLPKAPTATDIPPCNCISTFISCWADTDDAQERIDTFDQCMDACPTEAQPKASDVPFSKVNKRQTQETVEQCEKNCEAQWDVCMAGGHGEEYCDRITFKCWYHCPLPPKLGEVKDVSKRQDQCTVNCSAQLGTCLQGGHNPNYCQLIFDACQYQCGLSKTGNEEIAKRQNPSVVPTPIPVASPELVQCGADCKAKYNVCIRGGQIKEYCNLVEYVCKSKCPPAAGKEDKDAIVKRQTLPFPPFPEVSAAQEECLDKCFAEYKVCLDSGKVKESCYKAKTECYDRCPESFAKRQILTFPPPSPAQLECQYNCHEQYRICLKGGHEREYCVKISNACLAQCPDVWPKEAGEQISKREECPIVMYPEPKSEAGRQCLNNCCAQYTICRKGEHDADFCAKITLACVKQCPEAWPKDLVDIENLEKRQADPWRQCIDNCNAQYDVCMAGLHGIDYCISDGQACYKQCPDPTPKALEGVETVEKRQTLETISQCLSNCDAQYEICRKGGHPAHYCRTITNACYTQCQVSRSSEQRIQNLVIDKRQTLETTAQCILNCSEQFQICTKGGFSFETCARLTAACQGACPGLPEPEGPKESEKLSKKQLSELGSCEYCEEQYQSCVWTLAGIYDECMPEYQECREKLQCPPLPEWEELIEIEPVEPPVEDVKHQSSGPECDQCTKDWHACLETAPEWHEAQAQCVPTYKQCQEEHNCLTPPSPAEPTVTILPIDAPTVSATPAPESQPTVRQNEDLEFDHCFGDFYTCLGLQEGWTERYEACETTYFQCMTEHSPPLTDPEPWEELGDPLPPAVRSVSGPVKRQQWSPECEQCWASFQTCLISSTGSDTSCGIAYQQCSGINACSLQPHVFPPVLSAFPLVGETEPVKRQAWTPECDQCYAGLLTCLETDYMITCNPAYKHCLEVNACSLGPLVAPPMIPEPAFPPVEDREPVKRDSLKDCKQCEDELQVCIENRAPFQPLDQTCGFPYRQCLATCTPPPPPPPRPVKRNVDCGVCDRQAKFCMDSRGPAIHALDIICGIPHRQCLATCTRPHSDNGVCVKDGIEFEC